MNALRYELVTHRSPATLFAGPTGRPFNPVLAVVDMPTHTVNPLVDTGAIATTSLISGLFVARVAGNVVGNEALSEVSVTRSSILRAHLKLVLALAHCRCGAVTGLPQAAQQLRWPPRSR